MQAGTKVSWSLGRGGQALACSCRRSSYPRLGKSGWVLLLGIAVLAGWPQLGYAQIVCGDGACQVPGEDPCTCPQDCGFPPASEAGFCTDGIDNDCDMLIDCQDPDCFGDQACAGAICAPVPGSGCSGPCQNPTVDVCQTQCVLINPFTGDLQATSCNCESPNDCHVKASFAAGQIAGGGGNPCVVPDNGGGTITLPPEGCTYLSPDDVHMILDGLPVTNPPTTIELGIAHQGFFCTQCIGGVNHGLPCTNAVDCPGGFCRAENNICSFNIQAGCDQPGGGLGGEDECAESTLSMQMMGTGNLAGFNRNINLRIEFETHTAPRTPGNPVQSFDTDMFRLFGQINNIGDPDFDLLRITAGTGFGLPSPGHTTLTKLPGAAGWAVDSFFDITYRIDFIGAPGSQLAGMAGSTTGTIRMSTGSGASCVGACPQGQQCTEERTVDAAGNVTLCCNCEDLGACCDNTPPAPGTCTMTTAANCNGTFHAGQSCTGPQACCISGALGNQCLNIDPLCCADLGGMSHPGQTCTVPRACCLQGGACVDVDPVCCSGTPGPVGSTCANYNCNPVCEPIPGTGCGGPCPNSAEICQSQCVLINPLTGEVEATDCNCESPNDCHVKAPFAVGQVAGGGGNPCVVADNGSGTIDLPPDGCGYLSPDDVHMIIDGLPVTNPPTVINIGLQHSKFFCREICIGGINAGLPCQSDVQCPGGVCSVDTGLCSFNVDCSQFGGSLGGEQECSHSLLLMNMNGTGALSSLIRNIGMQIEFETHIGPRNPGDPVQSFDTDMFRLFGERVNPAAGDPDFDLLRIVAGTDFGLPSPGHTTLTKLPGGPNWAVDSYFDITYRIDFVGKPGGQLSGMSGSTTGTIRMVTGSGASCTGVCPPNETCEEQRTVNADGTINLCCNCIPEPACEPLPDKSGCTQTGCPCFGECINGSYCDDPNCCIDPNNCQCYAPNHQISIKLCGDCFGECIDGGYCDGGGPGCCIDPGNCLCYVPHHPVSIFLCGDCFGQCIGGSYCDGPNPACCVDPLNCPVCYSPTSPISLKMCADLPETCKAKCGSLNPFTGEFDVTDCDCLEDECHLKLPKNPGIPNPVTAGTGDACVVNDNGSGTVTLPPLGCEYLSPDEVHKIIDGLPPNTTIEFATIHKDFICNKQPGGGGVCTFPPGVDCEEPGGSLGGKKECRDNSTLSMDLNGTGALLGFMRHIDMPVSFETHTSPWPKDLPTQVIATDMFRLFGQMTNPGSGDPDFDLLRIVAGTDFGLPSPGHTTLTRLGGPGSPFHVDSFFDISYRIDFVGRPGGALSGMSGSTTGTIRMATGGAPACVGDCPPGTICVQTKTVVPDGLGGFRIDICCDCQPQVCEPKTDGTACSNVTCPNPVEECRPTKIKCTANGCRVIECDCQAQTECHIEMPPAGTTRPVCVGSCPVPPQNHRCIRFRKDLDGDGLPQEFYCKCALINTVAVGDDTCFDGNTNLGTPCSSSDDCPAPQNCGLKSRYLAVRLDAASAPTKIKLTILSMPQFPARVGEMWWAGPEMVVNNPPGAPLRGAPLVCNKPAAALWNAGIVYLFGSAIVPNATYAVQTCNDDNTDCTDVQLVVGTSIWGNVVSPHKAANFADISAVVDKFRTLASAPITPRTDLVGTGNPGSPSTPNQTTNFADVSAAVDAFRTFPYPFTVPACP